jgi:hypothetical protein
MSLKPKLNKVLNLRDLESLMSLQNRIAIFRINNDTPRSS